MADFVAVIRRTVDGLSDNSVDMRSKVYDKARSAVRRQLESMKPRPSDVMIDRQMAKLEAAITQVEADNSEAVPDVREAEVQFEQPAVPYDVSAVERHSVVVEPEPATPEQPPEPVAPVAVDEPYEPEPETVETPAQEPEPGPIAAPVEPVADDAGSRPTEEPPAAEAPVAPHVEQEVAPQPPAEPVEPEQAWSAPDPEPLPEPEPLQEPQPEPDAVHTPVEDAFEPAPVADEPAYAEPAYLETAPVETYPHAAEQEEPAPAYDAPADGQAEVHPDASLVDPAEYGTHAEATPVLPAASWELPEWTDPVPEPQSVTAHQAPVWHEAADESAIIDEFAELARQQRPVPADVVVPVVSGGLTPEGEPVHSWALDETDPFQADRAQASVEPAISDWSWPVDRSGAAEAGTDGSGTVTERVPENWEEIDALLATSTAGTASQARADGPLSDVASPSRPASYRAEPKKSAFSARRLITAAVLLLAIGGGGYAYWMNRDDVNGWVSGMIASINTPPPQSGGVSGTPATSSGTGSAASGTPAVGSNATTDGAAGGATKFTQRLQTDGSEVDDGAAPSLSQASAEQEGKSVAAQTEASRPADVAAATTPAQSEPAATEPAPAPGQAPDAVPAAQTPVTTPPAADQATVQLPAGAQKMFLYEERLGQTAPTAIEGGVAWSLKEETPEGSSRPEPVIQAQVTVPDRGLTALMTIKRNTDASLPASHTIEFVFSLPENFEGGSIDSVQRVAMKRTEQDRGDPLIAVPAKITDDFHMIALNDFPEAVTTNLDLLRTRSWIDIPLTYRNGRRALLTLEKGAAGTDAFDKALSAWSAIRPTGQ